MIFKIPCIWSMNGIIQVEAKSIDEAIHKTESGEESFPHLPEGSYIEDSFEIDYEGIEKEPFFIKEK